MTAAPISTAQSLLPSPGTGGPAAAGPGAGQGAGATGGAAFLAVLDQLLGRASAGLNLESTAGKAAETDGSGSENLPPWLPAFSQTDAQATGETSDESVPAETTGTAATETGDAATADTDANALLAGTINPALAGAEADQAGEPSADSRPAGPRGQAVAAAVADAKAALSESGEATSMGATGEAVSRAATAHAAEIRPTHAGRTEQSVDPDAEAALRAVTDPTADPDVDSVLAVLGRRANQPSSTAAAAQQGTTTGDEAEQLARSANPAAQTLDEQSRLKETAKGQGSESADRAAKGKDGGADALNRLLGAGQTQHGQATAAGSQSDGAKTDQQPFKPTSPAPTLLTINEIGAGTTGQTATATQTLTAGITQAGQAQPNIDAMALRIAHEARDGTQRFEIALDPPELGRVEVRLEFGRDGRMTTHLLVDRNDTLDALMRDGRGLERALQAHGLKLDDGGVQYHLRDQSSFAQQQGGYDAPEHSESDTGAADDQEATETAEIEQTVSRRRLALGGLDLKV
jgi:chemotaxis protein MotD